MATINQEEHGKIMESMLPILPHAFYFKVHAWKCNNFALLTRQIRAVCGRIAEVYNLSNPAFKFRQGLDGDDFAKGKFTIQIKVVMIEQIIKGKSALSLVLKGEWYDMIAKGRKTEEYRDLTPYWIRRICESVERFAPGTQTIHHEGNVYLPKQFDVVVFYHGYRKDRQQMVFECAGISLGGGKRDWGANESKPYFNIKLGRRLL